MLQSDDNYKAFLSYMSTHFDDSFTADALEEVKSVVPGETMSQFSNILEFVYVLRQIVGLSPGDECGLEQEGVYAGDLLHVGNDVEGDRCPSPNIVVPEEFEFVSLPCPLLSSNLDSLEAADERLSQPHVLDVVTDAAGSPGQSSVIQGDGSALVVEKKVGTHDMHSVFLANDGQLVCGERIDEDFNVCPRQISASGRLNILREEEEEDVYDDDDDEESETEFWFERSVNEKDEERFTFKADELAQKHSDSKIHVIIPDSEKFKVHSNSDNDLRVLCSSYTFTSCIQNDNGGVGLLESECEKSSGGPERSMTVGNHLSDGVGKGALDEDDRYRRNYSCKDHCFKCSNSLDSKQTCPLCSLMQNPLNEMYVSATSFVPPTQVHIDVDVEKRSAGLCDEEGIYSVADNPTSGVLSYDEEGICRVADIPTSGVLLCDEEGIFRVADIPTSGVLLCSGGAKRLLVDPSSVVGIRDLEIDVNRCIPSNVTSASRSVHVSSTKHEISSGSNRRSDQVEQIHGDDFIAEEAEIGPCDRKFTENAETQNLLQKKSHVCQKDFQNEGELYSDLDLYLETLTFPLACMSSDLNLSDFGLAPDQASCQGDCLDDVVCLRRKTSGDFHNRTSVKCDGIDNPAFFCDDLPEEPVDEDGINRRFFGSCDADSAVCYLNSDLPSVTIEECISDNDVSDEDSFEGGVCNAYEEVDHLAVINTGNMGETDTVCGKINDGMNVKNDYFFGGTSDENRDARSDGRHAGLVNACRKASAGIDGDVTEGVNQSPRLVPKCTDNLRFVNDIGQLETEPIGEEVRHVLKSPRPFIEAFEQEVRLIFSKRRNASPDFIADIGSNLSKGNDSICGSGLENGVVVSDAYIDDKEVNDSLRFRSENKDTSTLSHKKIMDIISEPNMSEKVLVNDVFGECSSAYGTMRRTISSTKEKTEASALLHLSESGCFSDELYTGCAIFGDDVEGLYLNLPLDVVNDLEKDTGAGANKRHDPTTQTKTAGWKDKNTRVVSVPRKSKDAAQMGTYSTEMDADEAHAQVNTEVTHNDIKNRKGAERFGKSKHLLPKKCKKCAHLAAHVAAQDLKVTLEASMPDVTNRNPLLAGDGLVSYSVGVVDPGASGRASENVEAETSVESVELNVDNEIRDHPAAVMPELSSSCTQSNVVLQARLPGPVVRNVCLRVEPGRALGRGLQSSDLSINSKVVMDDESETVVCSNSFCNNGAQATVTSTVNLLVPSLEVDIAIQKQDQEAADGTLELRQTSGEQESGGDRVAGQQAQINQVVPAINEQDMRQRESSSNVTFRFSHRIAYNDMLACALNIVDVVFWVCLVVAFIVINRNWTN